MWGPGNNRVNMVVVGAGSVLHTHVHVEWSVVSNLPEVAQLVEHSV